MDAFVTNWLWKTAWPMNPPLPFSAFHILFMIFGLSSAFLAAWLLRKTPESLRIRLLFLLGVLLALSEAYKQLFLYYIVNHGHYDWWYFPFQLCSIPMYFCLLLPFSGSRGRRVLCTFMYSYNLLGAMMVFVEPSGLMHPYWTLTLHSFMWHIILIFIGLLAVFSRMASPSPRCFAGATGLFLACCAIATGINILAHPLGNTDLFYITPYYPNTQIVYSQIASLVGIIPGNLIYMASIILGAWLFHLLYRRKLFPSSRM